MAGTWTARFEPTAEGVVYSASSVNGLKTVLKPGERIRTALFVLAPYPVRNEHYATNFWRDWFVSCNLPKADANGTPLAPFSSCCLSNDTGLPNSDGSISERYFTWRPSLEKMLAENVKLDFRWFDAGWYQRPDGGSEETDWWGTVGTWTLDPVKWPGRSFRESTDFAREHGMKTLMWFEPERVTDVDNLVKRCGYQKEWAVVMPGDDAIANNIGIPACRRWTADRIIKTLRENRVEMYREDNNCNIAALWRFLDEKEGEGRKGITECKCIEAHYALWDEIIEETLSYGGCGFVDSCASGGGRNDLESLRRGVPLLRSDSDRTSTSLRLSMTSSFNTWIPFCGASTVEKAGELDPDGVRDPYVWRASYLPHLNVNVRFATKPEENYDMIRFGLSEWDRVKGYLLKEFYPLTPWHHAWDVFSFTAFCFFDPEEEKGVLLAFRQEACVPDVLKLALPFAEGRRFTLTDEYSGEVFSVTDRIELRFSDVRESKLLWIKLN